MRIDKPFCTFKFCKYEADGNCTNEAKRNSCEFNLLVEREIPKPPEHKVHEKYKALGKNYYCSCGVMFVDFERNGTNYCGNCGQRLKGDGENE